MFNAFSDEKVNTEKGISEKKLRKSNMEFKNHTILPDKPEPTKKAVNYMKDLPHR